MCENFLSLCIVCYDNFNFVYFNFLFFEWLNTLYKVVESLTFVHLILFIDLFIWFGFEIGISFIYLFNYKNKTFNNSTIKSFMSFSNKVFSNYSFNKLFYKFI